MTEPYIRQGQRIRIKSNGSTVGTSVCVVGDDGREEALASVLSVTWRAALDEDRQATVCTAIVEFDYVEAEVEATVA